MSDILASILFEWGSLVLRWLHVVAGIAWIGSSFYFIALDLSLKKRGNLPVGVGGETWQVHGGGFYRMHKYTVAPPELPAELTWFKWEAYTTWFSGFALLIWIYYFQADLYTIDPAVAALPAWGAAIIGVGSLVAGWLLYDRLCRSRIGDSELALAAVGFVFVVAASWGYAQVFSARAAFLHTGALMATMMAGSVLLVIIPNQRVVVADLIAGRTPDPRHGKAAKQRSLHNNYLTLPVVFLMLSNHYPTTYSSPYAWAVVALIVVIGALIRHGFNTHHAGGGLLLWPWAAAAACLVVAIGIAAIPPEGVPARSVLGRARPDGERDPRFLAAVEVVQTRCAMCHAALPGYAGVGTAPKGVRLDTSGEIARQAPAIRVQAVLTRAMPPNNITDMTLREREALAAWLAQR